MLAKILLSSNKWHGAKKLIIAVIIFCNGLLLASNKSAFTEKLDDNSINSAQRTFPIYRDGIFYRYVNGTVLFIVGTSSAGKSSIVKELNNYVPKIKKEKFLISGADYLGKMLALKNVRSKFKGRLSFITQKDLWYCLLATQTTPRTSIIARLNTDVILKKYRNLLLSRLCRQKRIDIIC